ncbi:HAMP domain-containing sensor histidine kinase [Nitratifractor sp.]|uniref:sensor histidine kinase n=1 Tax=Nitratifractor sp. TaxID=2268144 RepID=UPI0025FBBF1B|nr:HAMP domain-containing sensor histidine kinase [Nitratifractor sp.]
MKKELIWSLVIFGTIIVAFFGIHFLFLAQEGFDRSNYLTAFAILFPGVMIVGYIFLSGQLESRHRQEEELEHLVREVLHEINLPLSTIEANTSMILKKSEDERLTKRIRRIEAASKRLARLYRELSYNIKRQIAPVEREHFDLADVVEERAAFFREMGRNPIETNLESTFITADRIGLEQTLDNLLENAMKYSDKKEPILIRLDGGELLIRDRGIGMDENEILRIYERYYQSDRNVKGEGIGLALVKRYCDDEGIGLRLRSVPGEGTEVSLDFSGKISG